MAPTLTVKDQAVDMENVSVHITTFNRPEGLAEVLKRVIGQFLVINVHSCDPEGTHENPMVFFQNYEPGKENYWKVINGIFQVEKEVDSEWCVILADDLVLSRAFRQHLDLAFWRFWDLGIRAFTFHRDQRGVRPQWTSGQPHKLPTGDFKIGWIEGACAIHRSVLRSLDCTVHPVDPNRWKINPLAGSGVWDQISWRLHTKRIPMGMTRKSLVLHAQGPSVMNSKERLIHPLITEDFVDEV